MNRDYIWRHIWSELELKCFIHLCKASFSDFPLEGGENSATDRENRSFGTTYEPYRSVNRCSEYRSRESSPTLYNCAKLPLLVMKIIIFNFTSTATNVCGHACAHETSQARVMLKRRRGGGRRDLERGVILFGHTLDRRI